MLKVSVGREEPWAKRGSGGGGVGATTQQAETHYLTIGIQISKMYMLDPIPKTSPLAVCAAQATPA